MTNNQAVRTTTKHRSKQKPTSSCSAKDPRSNIVLRPSQETLRRRAVSFLDLADGRLRRHDFHSPIIKITRLGRYAVPGVTMVGALVSLAAVFHQLSTGPKCTQPLDLALVAGTLLLSWALIQTILALHYAHEFYAEHRGSAGGLEFPDCEHPNYWDFIYFSFGIGMTFQVSDVRVTSRVIRKTVTAHGFASFMFNVTLLALSFNIAASALREPWCAI